MAGPEHKIQVGIVKWLRTVMPQAMIQHSKNEHYKRGTAGKIAGSMNKNAGVMSGFPDLTILPGDGKSFFLEVKTKTGTVSAVQKQVHIMLEDRGYPVGVVRSVEDVRAFLQANDIEFREVNYG